MDTIVEHELGPQGGGGHRLVPWGGGGVQGPDTGPRG